MINKQQNTAAQHNMHQTYHAQSIDHVLSALQSCQNGLTLAEIKTRQKQFGLNILVIEKPTSVISLLLRQFKSPLIYILVGALVISALIHEYSDALFIGGVLLINALIGAFQERSAERMANALRVMMPNKARVLRQGESFEVDAVEIVPGDIVLIESGMKIPADCRLISSHSLEMDESLLTGESVPVLKHAEAILNVEISLADRTNMLYSGTLVTRGQGIAVVVATGMVSEIGQISAVTTTSKPPLLLRMESFTRRVAYGMGLVVAIMLIMGLWHETPFMQMFYSAVALAVAAIPEALPVALTIVLAIGMERMAKRNVIVRKLIAVESLGSCTYIGSDKTGTLTLNELTAKRILLPTGDVIRVSGEGIIPDGDIKWEINSEKPIPQAMLQALTTSAVLNNDGYLALRDGQWYAQGDTVDIALLVMAHKLHVNQIVCKETFPVLAAIPYESEKSYSAVLCAYQGSRIVHVKGAPEKILSMCSYSITENGQENLDHKHMHAIVDQLARSGYRVIAIAHRVDPNISIETFSARDLKHMCLLGLIGIIDPVRKEVPRAIAQCQAAGMKVAMITGDHPLTAYAIGQELQLISRPSQVVTGNTLNEVFVSGGDKFDTCVSKCTVFARVNPQQKKDIIASVKNQGEFVAVTGDGVNDVPALRSAHVGVAMGKRGTDVAKESADIILTDDNFASIVAGIEEGRIAYANVRKVIYFTISTGAAEVILFMLALLFQLPLPLLPVQLLWLNLVTNGIQDVALAFEEAEGDELQKPPRNPKEPIFDRIMLRRVLLSSFTMAGIAFMVFYILLLMDIALGEARNITLLLMVLFENIQAFNCRSETSSLFKRGIFGNKLLILGVLAAQILHIAAMHIPILRDVLKIAPVDFRTWSILLLLSSIIFIVVELQKKISLPSVSLPSLKQK